MRNGGSIAQPTGVLAGQTLHCRVQTPSRRRKSLSLSAGPNPSATNDGNPNVDGDLSVCESPVPDTPLSGFLDIFSFPQRGGSARADRSRSDLAGRKFASDVTQVAALADDAKQSADVALQAEAEMGNLLSEIAAIDSAMAEQSQRLQVTQLGRSMSLPLPHVPSFLQVLRPKFFKRKEEQREACGNGREIMLQGFNWESHRCGWYQTLRDQADWFAEVGFTMIWLPPPTDSVSPQGYMPKDLYNLSSHYGGEGELRDCIKLFQRKGMKVVGDVVLNHRCATYQNHDGVWNQFGGKLDWDARAIIGNDPNFHGLGNHSNGEVFHAAPNIDHSQEFVRRDVSDWLRWLRKDIGFDGWRFDFVRGFEGTYIGEYVENSQPHFSVGEYWDTLNYDGDGSLSYNQDSHRQRICDWVNATGEMSTAFDITTKGILHAVLEKSEYWRLRDSQGKPPGLMGWWPSRAVTFVENHDTGSTQGHWRFPDHGVEQGYVYILTHPGTPTIFYDHLVFWQHIKDAVQELIGLRKRLGIHCQSSVNIIEATKDIYAAEIDGKLLMKIGPGALHVDHRIWNLVMSNPNWCIWEKNNE